MHDKALSAGAEIQIPDASASADGRWRLFDKLPRYDDPGLEYTAEELCNEKGTDNRARVGFLYLKDLFARHAGEVAPFYARFAESTGSHLETRRSGTSNFARRQSTGPCVKT